MKNFLWSEHLPVRCLSAVLAQAGTQTGEQDFWGTHLDEAEDMHFQVSDPPQAGSF